MDLSSKEIITFLQYFAFATLHLAGILMSLHALLKTRTSQGAIAWMLALTFVPYVALPLYLFLGKRKVSGYIRALRANKGQAKEIGRELSRYTTSLNSKEAFSAALRKLSDTPATSGNSSEILVDGEATFASIFQAIREAKVYILLQSYIVRGDDLGNELKSLLLEKAAQGVRIYFLYDDIGSHALKKSYVEELRRGGVDVVAFRATKLRSNRFQINFRNHRKIVVTDGLSGFLGGLNIGDEYLGKSPIFGLWRDTHVKIQGPAVLCLQIAFLEDWNWCTGKIPDLHWQPQPQVANEDMLILATGPADESEACGLFFVETINQAKKRLCIATPYFVPDAPVTVALILACLRGVKIRLMIPKNPDHKLVYYARYDYLELLMRQGMEVYEYVDGFMHQKMMIVDEDLSVIGSANFDNRSFRLNFEIIAAIADKNVTQRLSAIFEADFARCAKLELSSWKKRTLIDKLLTRFARLFAPIL